MMMRRLGRAAAVFLICFVVSNQAWSEGLKEKARKAAEKAKSQYGKVYRNAAQDGRITKAEERDVNRKKRDGKSASEQADRDDQNARNAADQAAEEARRQAEEARRKAEEASQREAFELQKAQEEADRAAAAAAAAKKKADDTAQNIISHIG